MLALSLLLTIAIVWLVHRRSTSASVGLPTAGGIGVPLPQERSTTSPPPRSCSPTERCCASTPTTTPDLFWAIGGAGANFGIATGFEFDAYFVGDVVLAQMLGVRCTRNVERSLRRSRICWVRGMHGL